MQNIQSKLFNLAVAIDPLDPICYLALILFKSLLGSLNSFTNLSLKN